ncbi:unnamed protein product [Amaranthus hypochondriacus]
MISSKFQKIFHQRSTYPIPLFGKQNIVQILFIVLGIAGLIFGLTALSGLFSNNNNKIIESTKVPVVCDQVNDSVATDGVISNDSLKVNGEIKKRYKVKGFVGIFTGFGSVGRRRALRQTWLPSTRDGLQRLEEGTGLRFRFIIGRTDEEEKMSELKKEIAEYDDFVELDLIEEYRKLPYKTLTFLKAVYALYDSEYYVKADDDIYLRPDRLSLLLDKERSNPRTYMGCMKHGIVFKTPKVKWYEPLAHLFGPQYFLHAYGPIYVLSAKVVQTLASISDDDFRMFGNEDVMIGAWMVAMNVNHEDVADLCSNNCTSTSIAVWDKPKCSGLCDPETSLLELHNKEDCTNNNTTDE